MAEFIDDRDTADNSADPTSSSMTPVVGDATAPGVMPIAEATVTVEAPARRDPYTLIEFFAGGGLVRLGFGLGWKVLMANDIDESKAESYARNFGADVLKVCDVWDVKACKIPKANVWSVTFPCPDFSCAGLGRGFEAGPRATVVFATLKRLQYAVRHGTAPEALVFENVLGFVGKNGGRELVHVIKALVDIGYKVGPLVMDAARWLPQHRRRLFMVAVRKGIELPPGLVLDRPSKEWSTPTLRKVIRQLGREVAENVLWFSVPLPEDPPTPLADILEPARDDQWADQDRMARLLALANPLAARRMETMRAAGGVQYGTTLERGFKTGGEATVSVGLFSTIMASTTGTARQRLLVIDGPCVRCRDLTPREFGRAMGVPEGYVLPEALTPALHLLGDGVAVPVIRHLAKHVLEPLLAAAVPVAVVAPPRDGRRPIKDQTVSASCYLQYPEHRRLKDLAIDKGVPLSGMLLDGLDLLLIRDGRDPLNRYPVPSSPAPPDPAAPGPVAPDQPDEET